MKKPRLIKKAELAEQRSLAQLEPQPREPRQASAKLIQQTLSQWIGAQQNARPQNARAAFAALFTVKA
jgi:hypothetical protein